MLQVMGHACRQELAFKPTTLEEDERMLQEGQAATNLRLWNALQLRVGCKRLLLKCADQADAARVFLETENMAMEHVGVETQPVQPAAPQGKQHLQQEL